MKTVLVAAGALVGLVVTAGGVQGFGHKAGCGDCCAPVCAPQIKWVEKKVTCYRTVMREKQVTCTINRFCMRPEMTQVTRTIMVPEMKCVTKTVMICNLVPRTVEREVPCTVMVPYTAVDKCTGCEYTACKPQVVMRKVCCVVLENHPIQKQVTVPVCTYRPVQETVPCCRMVCETRPETVTQTVRYCELVPYQAVVLVPVCQ
jgi:hypothetical protein